MAELEKQRLQDEENAREAQRIAAAKQSISAEPEESEDTSTIVFRVPSGSRVTRRFLRNDTVEKLYCYIDSIK